MKKIVFFLFLSVLPSSAFSQSNIFRDLESFTDQYNFEKSETHALEGTSYNKIEGSAYLDQDFIPGEVKLNDTTRFEEVPLRYNVYSDKMEFMTPQNYILEIDNSDANFTFYIGDQTFKNKNYLYNNEKQKGILELLSDGEIKLYKKHRISFEPATKPKGFQEAEPDRFEKEKDRYFISIEEERPQLVMRKKDLEKILKPHCPDIKDYIKSERIKVKNEKDLIKLIEHCNQ
ncbi:MAG: hypothetical protein ACOC2F_06735 [Bacteroidota bacterium]